MSQQPAEKHALQLTVNGQAYALQVPARRTLLDLLRDDLHLTGTKKVCDMGHCGACTVLRDGMPVLSCLTLAASCDAEQITTNRRPRGPRRCSNPAPASIHRL